MLLSLSKIHSSTTQILDLGDRKPGAISDKNLIDSSLPDIPRNSTLENRVSILINSKATAQIVWCLTNIPKLFQTQPNISCKKSILANYLPKLISFLYSDNFPIEYHSIYCLTSIAQNFSNHNVPEASNIFQVVLDRIKTYPTIEYATLIEKLIPFVPDSLLSDQLTPLLFSMLKMNDSYQHFSGKIFSILPFERITKSTNSPDSVLSPNNFNQFFSSKVVSINYLPEISKRAIKSPLFGEHWFLQVLPQQLMTMANIRESIRPAAAKVIMSNLDLFMEKLKNEENKILSVFALTTFSWASNNDEICLYLLENATTVLTVKKEKYIQKYIELISRIINTTNLSIKRKLPKVFSESPLLFSIRETQQQKQLFKAIIKMFMRQSNTEASSLMPKSSSTSSNMDEQDELFNSKNSFSIVDSMLEVRMEFLKCLPAFYQNYTSREYQDIVVRSFAQFFTEQNIKLATKQFVSSNNEVCTIASELVASPMYEFINHQMYDQIMPQFLQLASLFTDKWRVFEQCLKTYLILSDQYFMQYIEKFKPIILSAMIKNSRPLTKICQLFLSKLLHISQNAKCIENIEWIAKHFARNQSAAMRSFYISFSSTLAYMIPFETFVDNIWPTVLQLSNDPCMSVIACLVRHIPTFKRYFNQMSNKELEIKTNDLFKQIKKTNQINLEEKKTSDLLYLAEVINETENSNNSTFIKDNSSTFSLSHESNRLSAPNFDFHNSSPNSKPTKLRKKENVSLQMKSTLPSLMRSSEHFGEYSKHMNFSKSLDSSWEGSRSPTKSQIYKSGMKIGLQKQTKQSSISRRVPQLNKLNPKAKY